MHSMIFVVGDNPLDQLDQLAGNCRASIDWFGIGGRYSGTLILQPGAEGKRYGDTLPAAEAHLAALMPEGVSLGRSGARGDRPGVDQARACDVDWEATITGADRRPRAVVIDTTWRDTWDVLTTEEAAALTAAALIDPADIGEVYVTACGKVSQWDREVLGPILAAAEECGQLVTVVDIHE